MGFEPTTLVSTLPTELQLVGFDSAIRKTQTTVLWHSILSLSMTVMRKVDVVRVAVKQLVHQLALVPSLLWVTCSRTLAYANMLLVSDDILVFQLLGMIWLS